MGSNQQLQQQPMKKLIKKAPTKMDIGLRRYFLRHPYAQQSLYRQSRLQDYIRGFLQLIHPFLKKRCPLTYRFSVAHILSTKTLYSLILLISFNYLMVCPVTYAFHKGNINCCCPSCADVSWKRKIERSDTGPAETLAAIAIKPLIYDWPGYSKNFWTTSDNIISVNQPFLATVKLLL